MSKSPREPAALPEPAAIEEPKLEPVKAVMPTIDTKSVEEARRRSLLRQTQRQGRESTILTEDRGPSDSLGGGY
jgi:hypothetical protein